MRDLFNDKTVLSTFPPVAAALGCSSVKFKKLNSSVINMAYFDFLQEKKLVQADGSVKMDYDEWVDGIQLSNRLRKAMLWEESEYFGEL